MQTLTAMVAPGVRTEVENLELVPFSNSNTKLKSSSDGMFRSLKANLPFDILELVKLEVDKKNEEFIHRICKEDGIFGVLDSK